MDRLLEFAFGFYGLKEIPGEQHNLTILGWLKYLGFSHIRDDETGWCSTFAMFVAKKNGYEVPLDLRAISWLEQGEKVTEPELGDLIVFDHHVTFFVAKGTGIVYGLGGNQSNSVNITPFKSNTIISYIRLPKKIQNDKRPTLHPEKENLKKLLEEALGILNREEDRDWSLDYDCRTGPGSLLP